MIVFKGSRIPLKKLDAVSKSMKFDVVWISIKLAVKSEK